MIANATIWPILTKDCKKHSSTPTICWKFSRAFGTHPGPFIRDDVYCYSQLGLIRLQNCSINWWKGPRWIPKALLNFQQIVGVEAWNIFCNIISQQKNMHLLKTFYITLHRALLWCRFLKERMTKLLEDEIFHRFYRVHQWRTDVIYHSRPL